MGIVESMKNLKSGYRITFAIKRPTTVRVNDSPNRLEVDVDRVFCLQNDGKSVKIYGKEYFIGDIDTDRRKKDKGTVQGRNYKESNRIHIEKYFREKSKHKLSTKNIKLARY